jgi:DNA-binding CsgD family transcriptional regulator
MRFVRGHATRRNMLDYVVDENGCWIWQRGLSETGYGLTGTGADAHRRMYENDRGVVPDGMNLEHLCRVRACVNPWHLEPVTPQENTRRGAGLGGLLEEVSRRASYRRARKLTPEQVRAIRSSNKSNRELAHQLAVSHETVRAVRNRTLYKEV